MSDLEKLATALRARAMTAAQIARFLNVSKPTAYARLRALRIELRGQERLTKTNPPRAKPGPAPSRYQLLGG